MTEFASRILTRPPLAGMLGGEPDIHGLDRQIAVLEERMNTHQADYKAALTEFRNEMVKRDIANLRWIIGMMIALGGIGVAIIVLIVQTALGG